LLLPPKDQRETGEVERDDEHAQEPSFSSIVNGRLVEYILVSGAIHVTRIINSSFSINDIIGQIASDSSRPSSQQEHHTLPQDSHLIRENGSLNGKPNNEKCPHQGI
jgi:hypothetical protein